MTLGSLALAGRLARGGMAEVWRGTHVDGTPVAVKVIVQAKARDPRFARALREEVRAVAALSHPGIVTVLDEGVIDGAAEVASGGALAAGSPFLVLELASGGSLDQHDPPGTFAALRERLLALLDALAHAHARGVVHRDLKPGNVLVATDADLRPGLKLSDFGLAVAFDRTPELAATAGTPAFMAPEQFRGDWRSIGPATDLYAVGCMAWFWTTWRPLFQGDRRQLSRAHQQLPVPAFHPRFAVPPGFEAWIRALLVKDPLARCARAADAAHALLQLGLPDTFGPSPAASRLVTLPTLTEIPDSEAEVVELAHPAAAAVPEERPRLPPPPVPESWDGGVPAAFPPSLVGAGLALFGSRAVPVVGRHPERAILWNALRRVARTGRPAAVIVRGAAGTGKTRLAEWLSQRAEEVGAAVALRATHEPRGGPHDGLAGMLARHLRTVGLAGTDLRDRLAQRLRGGVSIDAVAALLGDAPPGHRWSRAEDRWVLAQRLLALEAEARPVVAWIDDAHWGADAVRFTTWALRGAVPALFVLTVRDEALAAQPSERGAIEALARTPGVEVIDLPALAVADCATLLRAMLSLEPSLATRVAARADGNPLFAVQLVGDWVARGLLEAGERGFVLAAGARPVIPDDLHALWAARVAQVVGDEEAVRALEIAAVLGMEVDEVEWRDVARRLGARVPAGLAEDLLASGLAVGRAERWRFAHGLLRESLDRRATEGGRAARAHAACAAMLAAGTGGPVRARRARHLVEAGRIEEALPELLAAASEVGNAGDAALAHALLEDWRRALDRMALPEDDLRRGEGLVLQVENLIRQEDFAEAFAVAHRGIALARRHGWRRALAGTLRAAGTVGYLTGRLDEADEWLAEARDLFVTERDPDGEVAALCALGHVARVRGALERAAHFYAEALQLRGSAPERYVHEALLGLGIVCWYAGDHGPALEVLAEARTLVERSGSQPARVAVHTFLGEVARDRGDLQAALEHYRQAAELERGAGREGIVPRLNLAIVLALSERWADARAMLEPLIRQARHQASPLAEAFGRCVLLVCDAAEARWDAFDTGLDAVERALEATGVVEPDVALLLHQSGRHAAHAGHEDRAQAAFAVALRQYRALGREDRVAEVRSEMLGTDG